MNRSTFLQALTLGSDVAENDNDLRAHFLETTDFRAVASGSVDVILGAKGQGKSAIYRMLSTDGQSIDDISDVDVVSAFNPAGSPIFRAILGKKFTEQEAVLIWTAYISVVVANHLVSAYGKLRPRPAEISEIKSFLRATDLLERPLAISLLEKVRRADGIGISVSTDKFGNPRLGLLVSYGGETSPSELTEEHFQDLFRLCQGAYSRLGRRCWVAFDRLDEAFPRSSPEERTALRGLLRSHLALAALDAGKDLVRAKIFLRSDIFRQLAKDRGLANASHLRKLNLSWNARSLILLVHQRASTSAEWVRLMEGQGIDAHSPAVTWTNLYGAKVNDRPSHDWVARTTADGFEQFNPRNVLTFTSLAVNKTIDLERNRPEERWARPPLINPAAMQPSWTMLSNRRLDDTIYSEFPELKEYVDRLKGHRIEYGSLRELAEVLTDGDETQARSVADELVDVGLLYERQRNLFGIARLYRPSLKVRGR